MYSLVRSPQERPLGPSSSMFSRKTVCFVTGASRGFGESIALNFAERFPDGTLFVLLARSGADLEAVKSRLLQKAPKARAVTRVFDQGTLDQQAFESVFSETIESAGAKVADFEQAVLVNNAGSIKPTVYVRNLPAVGELSSYLNVNVSGVIALTSQFLKTFASAGTVRAVINISSLAAVQPFKSWAMYCSGKAARDMFFSVLAAEEEDVRVLNYAPGPLQTDMASSLVDSEDEGVRNWAIQAKAENQLLSCDTSVNKLLQILEKNSFKNGAHIDFYDEI